MKLILLALVIAILYQASTQAMARAQSRADSAGKPQARKERRPLLSRSPRPTIEKDITHRGRVIRD